MNKRIRKKKQSQCSLELGNLFFGNSRGIFSVPREWQVKMLKCMEEMKFDSEGFYEGILKDNLTPRGGFENDVFVLNPYYWGEDESIAAEPNFIYKPTQYKLDWYKYPLRDSYANQDISFSKFAEILNKCRKSIFDMEIAIKSKENSNFNLVNHSDTFLIPSNIEKMVNYMTNATPVERIPLEHVDISLYAFRLYAFRYKNEEIKIIENLIKDFNLKQGEYIFCGALGIGFPDKKIYDKFFARYMEIIKQI